MSSAPIEGTAVEIPEADIATGSALAERQATGTLTVVPAADAGDLVERLAVIKSAMDRAMTPDVDYGVIPGTNKPALLKPGAEKLAVLFQLDVQLVNEKTWGPGDHLTVESKAIVFHIPTGARIGSGEGMCTTREKKYGKRTQDRACPQCGANAIKRSKYPPRENPSAEPGWYCFAKIGGCGANFAADADAITSQATGEIENPDLADTWNTVVKMAEKRARVDAILSVTGASALFTQDIEADASSNNSPESQQPPASSATPAGPAMMSPEQYDQIVKLFKDAGSNLIALDAHLTDIGAPSAASAPERLAFLTHEQAARLIAILNPLPEGSVQ